MTAASVGRLRALARALVLAALPAACAGAAREPLRPAGLPLAWSAAACARADVDADRDGLDDRCELALARAFAPELIVDARDCLWRADGAPPRLDGGYLFVAQPMARGVRVAYLPAYFRDCGWSGAVCLLRGGDCSAHAGDSELVVVDVEPEPTTGRWRTVGVFLSAHCLGRSDGRCRWFRGDALGAFTWADGETRGAPRVWVARGKHANYPSRGACDRGHWLLDSCDDNRVVMRFPVLAAGQNAGSRLRPLAGSGGCLASEALPLGAEGAGPAMVECVWDDARPFRGWQADSTGSAPTPYARLLERFADL